jgi:hypothetical protein
MSSDDWMGVGIVLSVLFVLVLATGVYFYSQTPDQQAIRNYSPQDFAKYVIVKNGYADSVEHIELDSYDVRAGAAQGRSIGADIFIYDFTIHESENKTCRVIVESSGSNHLLGLTYDGEIVYAE